MEKGELSSSKTVEGIEVTVQCMKKHVLIGQEKVTCQSSGHWSTLPRCLKCGKYRNIHRAQYFWGGVPKFDESEARMHCFLTSDWSELETIPQEYCALLNASTNTESYLNQQKIFREAFC